MLSEGKIPSSFRDPSGFVFTEGYMIYRQVNKSYKQNYDYLKSSGLYEALIKDRLLIPHTEVSLNLARNHLAYKVIQPQVVPFISYPYEWCFSQLKDAALLTLEVQKRSLSYGMSLKDASTYNIQFVGAKPMFIDTLSFEIYHTGAAWVPYRQFCQHFLAPLALMSYVDVWLNQLFQTYIDGIPLDLVSNLLPLRSRFSMTLLLHIHLHARSQRRFAKAMVKKEVFSRGVRYQSLLGLIDNLESGVRNLQWNPRGSAWADYYQDNSYNFEDMQDKQALVARFIAEINPKSVWDLGANTGLFSRISSQKGILTIACDNDPGCVEVNYRQAVRDRETNLLPLVVDVTNPSHSIGWENSGTMAFLERGPADVVLALALIHHLSISNNIPMDRIAQFFARISNWLIIEFVPKTDCKVQRLLAAREDIFPDYTHAGFVSEFGKFFTIRLSQRIKNSERTIFLMERK